MAADDSHAQAKIRQLAALLDEQIISAENGRFKRVANLAEASSILASDVAEARAFERAVDPTWQQEIVRRYRRLELILGAAKETAGNELKQVQTTRNMLASWS